MPHIYQSFLCSETENRNFNLHNVIFNPVNDIFIYAHLIGKSAECQVMFFCKCENFFVAFWHSVQVTAAVNPENGYRCYNYHQSPLLETILLLPELEVPIQAIQDYIKNRSAENLKDLLDESADDCHDGVYVLLYNG